MRGWAKELGISGNGIKYQLSTGKSFKVVYEYFRGKKVN